MSKDTTYRRLIQAKEWRVLRNAYLTEHPQCEECLSQGRHVAANCVHHITPVESARTEDDARVLCYSWANLRALCIACHSDIHKAERSHSKEAHQQRVQDAFDRWKATHPAPTASKLPTSGGVLEKTDIDSQIHCRNSPLTEENSKI